MIANGLDEMDTKDTTKYKGNLEKMNRAKFMLLIDDQDMVSRGGLNSRSFRCQRRHINNLQTTERPASPVIQNRSPADTAKDEAAYLESDFKRWQK